MENTEEWRICAVAPNYAVSNMGRVRRETEGPGTYPGKIKGGEAKTRGYPVVMLVSGKKRRAWPVHLLVCRAFHGEPPPNHEAAHHDGNRLNNRADNLSWKLPIDNTHDKYRHGTMPMGRKHWKGVLSDADVQTIRSSVERKETLAERYRVSPHWIYCIRTGRGRHYVR